MTAQNVNIEELLKETYQTNFQSKTRQAEERAQALRFLCEHLIKYLKENNFHADFIKFFNENIEKTDSFLGGEQMFVDLSEEKLNVLCDLLANELFCFLKKRLSGNIHLILDKPPTKNFFKLKVVTPVI